MPENPSTTKFNWKVGGLALIVYYSVEIWLAILLAILDVPHNRVYRLLIALISAVYFYQDRKLKAVSKREVICVGVVGLITVVALVVSL